LSKFVSGHGFVLFIAQMAAPRWKYGYRAPLDAMWLTTAAGN
jgi:hypothetical protein